MENCKECPYRAEHSKKETICKINSAVNPRRCPLPDGGIENKKVCYNCSEWIGGGDFGLSCRKHYHIATTNGLRDACEDFSERTAR